MPKIGRATDLGRQVVATRLYASKHRISPREQVIQCGAVRWLSESTLRGMKE